MHVHKCINVCKFFCISVRQKGSHSGYIFKVKKKAAFVMSVIGIEKMKFRTKDKIQISDLCSTF